MTGTPGTNQVRASGIYTQSFNGILPTQGNATWTNNSTIPAWYAAFGNASTSSFPTINAAFPFPNNTSNSTLYSVPQHFENNTANSTYRAIGLAATNSTPQTIGVRFVNNTNSTITGCTVSYEIRWGYTQNNTVDAFDVIAGGSGYTTAPTVTIVGNATSAATANATVNTSGNVNAVNRLTTGGGYSEIPSVSFNGTGSGASARTIMKLKTSSNSVALKYNIFNPGSGSLAASGWTTANTTTYSHSTTSAVPDNWTYVFQNLTNLSIAPSQEVWLSWTVNRSTSGSTVITAIDNVRVGEFALGNPAILAQPVAQSVIAGTKATLAVTASANSTITYQWRRNGQNISGATGSNFTISAAQATDTGLYDVVVTSGGASVTSAVVPVQVFNRSAVKGPASFTENATVPAIAYTQDAALGNITVTNTANYTNQYDLYLPDAAIPTGGRPAVVVIHGGGGNDGDKADGREVQACAEFASHGYVALSINYKRSFRTNSSGNWTTAWPQNIKDAKTAVRWLRANAALYGIDPNRIGAVGFSWGGNEAAMLAVTDGDPALDPSAEDGLGVFSTKVACASNFYGAVMIPDYHNMNQFSGNGVPGSPGTMDFTGTPNNYLSASPASRVTSAAAPMLLNHGDADLEVMPTQNFALRAGFLNAGAPVQSMNVPGGLHSYSLYETDTKQGGSPANPIDVRAETFGFYDKYLLPRPPAITSPSVLAFSSNSAFSHTVTASNSPTSFTATGLPVGWSINSTTGAITGTMPATGNRTLTVYATGTTGTAISTLTFSAVEGITVSANSTGTTPSLLGYNLGHLTDKGNGFDWFRYSGVKGARVFLSASELQSQTSPGRAAVTSNATFWSTISKARQLGTTKSTYIRWSDFNYDYTSTSGSNDITYKYAFTQLRSIGVDILVNITASPGTFPITSSTDWAGKWELWQHFYAQAYLLGRDYDIRRFSMFNEPNNWTGMTEPDWFERLRICSDAIQTAIADMNAARGKNLSPLIYAPNTANGKEKYNTASDTWGRDTIVNRRLKLDGTTDPLWSLSHIYNYQKYSTLTNDSGGLSGYITDITDLRAIIAADLGGDPMPPIALTEYNVRTGSNYDTKTESQDTPSDYVALAANSIALAANGASELFLFKFGQTASGGVNYEVAKNGTHYAQNASGTDNNYGGATKAAEVYRLFNKAALGGRERLEFTASTGAASSTTAGLWTLATRDSTGGFCYVFLANKNLTSVPLELNLSNLGIPDGTPAIVEKVEPASSAQGIPVGNIANGRVAIGSIPAQSVWLATIPLTASGLSSMPATQDAQISDGTGRNLTGGVVSPMLARADGTANGRRAVLIKIPITPVEIAANKSFLLDLEAVSSANSTAQAHVYGVASDNWDSDSATWATQTNFLRQNLGNGTQIASNVVINTGATPPAQMLGQIVAQPGTPSRLALDVTPFVKNQSDGNATFLIVQDHRWDYSADTVGNRTTGDVQASGILVTPVEKTGAGPRLLGLSANASTSSPVIFSNPTDRYLELGANATLSVSVDASLPHTIQWYKDGVPLGGANSQTLVLSNVTTADSGEYTAEVTNANGSSTSAVATVAINAAPVCRRQLGNALAIVGEQVTLSADFSGYPPPSYAWSKNGVPIEGASGTSLSFIATADSAGNYTITATNPLGTASSTASVEVQSLANGLLSVNSTNSTITENFNTLGKSSNYSVQGTTYYGWTNGDGWNDSSGFVSKPGWYAATDENRSPFEGYRTVNSNDPSEPPPRSESGLAGMGSASSSTDRALGGIPYLDNRVYFGVRLRNNTGKALHGFTVNYTLEQYSAATSANSSTTLKMSAAVNPASLRSPGWTTFATNNPLFFRSKTYSRIDGNNPSYSANRSTTVTGLSIAPGDSFWVRWEVATASPKQPLAMAIDNLSIGQFTLATAPSISAHPISQSVTANETLLLSVNATASPPPSFQWLKNGLEIQGATSSSLTFDHIAPSDEGSYSVRVSNIAGNTTSTAATLTVNTVPVFVVQPSQSVSAFIGGNATLFASAEGTPPPTLQWQKDGINLAGKTSSSLALINLQLTDSGFYSLVATNAAGTATSDLINLVVSASGIESWKSQAFGANSTVPSISGSSADPDGDGYSNTHEFAFGGNPLAPGSGGTSLNASGGNLTFSFLRRKNAADASYEVRWITDLTQSFSNGTPLTPSARNPQPAGVPADYEQVDVVTPINGPRGFLRVQAVIP